MVAAVVGHRGFSARGTAPRILIDWSQSYMNGTVAMMGGALVFGAMRRIMRPPATRDAVLLGLGLVVLQIAGRTRVCWRAYRWRWLCLPGSW